MFSVCFANYTFSRILRLLLSQWIQWRRHQVFRYEPILREYWLFFTRPSIEISTKTHLCEFPAVTHVVKNQINVYFSTSDRVTFLLFRFR